MKTLRLLIFTFGYRKISVLFAVFIIQIGELLLLQRMYNLFTGGYLQPFSYLTWTDQILFIALSLWMDLVLFGTLGAFWFWLAFRCGIRPLLAGFNYMFFTVSGIGVWLTVKYRVLSYFNDTLNFMIINNLGGGNLFDALTYISSEVSIIGISLLMLGLFFWAGLHLSARLEAVGKPTPGFILKGGIRTGFISSLLAVTIVLAILINSNPALHYGLSKKTSYSLVNKTLDTITDFDADGFGLFRFSQDPAPLDSTIYPGAMDYPDNGIDEDGFGGDFLWAGPTKDPLSSFPHAGGKHILLIVLESARGDLIGKMWAEKLIAPNITKIARRGSNVEYAYSHTGYTTSSIKAIFNRTLSSKPDRITLTAFLKQLGYSLSFISGQDESFGNIHTSTGMNDIGNYFFDAQSALEDRVYPSKNPGSIRLSEQRILTEFIRRTSEVNWEQPQFFYINLQAAHFPYTHPGMPTPIIEQPIPRSEISKTNRHWLEGTYWNAIAVADQTVGAMIDNLKDLGIYDNTTVMITGDHGESLFDDNFLGHGHALNQNQTWIPLVINQPDLDIHTAIAQTELAQLLTQIASNKFNASEWNDTSKPVFQYVGSLHNPQLIGIVSHGETRTILDMRTHKVYFSDLKQWKDFDTAWKDPKLGHRTQKLIQLWETKRWEDHLSQKQFIDQ